MFLYVLVSRLIVFAIAYSVLLGLLGALSLLKRIATTSKLIGTC